MGSVEPERSVVGVIAAVTGATVREDARPDDSVQSTGNPDLQAPGWTKRVRDGRPAPDRTPCTARTSALEKSIRGYAEKLGDEVIDPYLGTTFYSLREAYDFCNLVFRGIWIWCKIWKKPVE